VDWFSLALALIVFTLATVSSDTPAVLAISARVLIGSGFDNVVKG
jgi:hypothetical protein